LPEERFQNQLQAKKGILAVAKELGVGTGTIQRIEVSRPFDGVNAAA